MELQTGNNLIEEPKKSGRGQYERKKRGGYKTISEKKVTVEHFLNTKIDFWKSKKSMRGKNTPTKKENSSLHPVYIKVSFNGKMTFLRSETQESFSSLEEYEEQLKEDYFARALEREVHFIKSYIIEKAKHPSQFDSHESPLVYFDYDDFKIDNLIEYALLQEISELAKSIFPNDNPNKGLDYTGFCNDDETINEYYEIVNMPMECQDNLSPRAFEVLYFLGKKDVRFLELKNIFKSDIWFMRCYDKLENSNDKGEGYSYFYPSLIDYTEGRFKDIFLKSNSKNLSDAENIIYDINQLIQRKTLKLFKYY